jgi:hypothetical protein
MKDQELHKLLEQLHEEIERTQNIDEQGEQLLRDLESDIQHLLDRSETSAHPSTVQRLEDSIRYYEVTHPTLTSTLSKLLAILSNAGI